MFHNVIWSRENFVRMFVLYQTRQRRCSVPTRWQRRWWISTCGWPAPSLYTQPCSQLSTRSWRVDNLVRCVNYLRHEVLCWVRLLFGLLVCMLISSLTWYPGRGCALLISSGHFCPLCRQCLTGASWQQQQQQQQLGIMMISFCADCWCLLSSNDLYCEICWLQINPNQVDSVSDIEVNSKHLICLLNDVVATIIQAIDTCPP